MGSSKETARDPQVEENSRPRVREAQGSRSKPTVTLTTSRNLRATAPVPGAAHSLLSEHRWRHGDQFPPMGNQIEKSGGKEYATRAIDGSAKSRSRVEDSLSSNGVSVSTGMVGPLTQTPPSDYLSPQRSISYPELRLRQPESSTSANENEEFTVHHHGDKQSPSTEQQDARDHSRQPITPVGDNVDVGEILRTAAASGTQGSSKGWTAVGNTERHHDENDAGKAARATITHPFFNDSVRHPVDTPTMGRQASRSTTRRREATATADTQRHEDSFVVQAGRRSTRRRRQTVTFDVNNTIITRNGRESPKQRAMAPMREDA